MKGVDSARSPDPAVTAIVMALTVLGLVLVFSASPLGGRGDEFAISAGYFKRSLGACAVGFIAFFYCSRIEAERLRTFAYPALIVSVVLLVLVWMPAVGATANGATRWVKFGPLRFQPSEIAKLSVILFLAHSIAKRGERMQSFAFGFLPNLLLPGIPIVLVLLEPDLGTAAVLVAVVFAVTFAGGVKKLHLFMATVPATVIAGCMIWFVDFRRERVLAYLDPWDHARTSGYQLCQSLLAFGSGGITGVGLGAGKQKLHYLPEAHTDFILSIWAEEAGLIGVIAVITLVALLVVRGYVIAIRQEDPFRRLLATGLTTWLGLQAATNAMVVTGCVPTKGLPFPFLSYGGSGLVVCLAGAGLLAGLSRKERPA